MERGQGSTSCKNMEGTLFRSSLVLLEEVSSADSARESCSEGNIFSISFESNCKNYDQRVRICNFTKNRREDTKHVIVFPVTFHPNRFHFLHRNFRIPYELNVDGSSQSLVLFEIRWGRHTMWIALGGVAFALLPVKGTIRSPIWIPNSAVFLKEEVFQLE